MPNDRDTTTATPLPCPFCARAPKVSERPASDADGGGYFCFIACYCDGFSACAHKMARADTAAAARSGAISIWNRRALAAAPSPVPAQEPGPWLIEHTDGTLEKTRDRERAYLARHLGHTVTPLYAAPVGQADPWPEDPTPAMLEALRTGSRKDYPSDELCRVRYAALRAAVGAVGGQAEDAARWQPIGSIGKSADLVWVYIGGTVEGPMAEWIAESRADSFTHWAPCKPPSAEPDPQAVQPQPGDAR